MQSKVVFIVFSFFILSCQKSSSNERLLKHTGLYVDQTNILSDSIYEEWFPNGDGEVYIEICMNYREARKLFLSIKDMKRFPIEEVTIDQLYYKKLNFQNNLYYKLLTKKENLNNQYSLLVFDSTSNRLLYFYSGY